MDRKTLKLIWDFPTSEEGKTVYLTPIPWSDCKK